MCNYGNTTYIRVKDPTFIYKKNGEFYVCTKDDHEILLLCTEIKSVI